MSKFNHLPLEVNNLHKQKKWNKIKQYRNPFSLASIEFWQGISTGAKTQNLFSSQFASPALIMSAAAAGVGEVALIAAIILPDSPISPVASSPMLFRTALYT